MKGFEVAPVRSAGRAGVCIFVSLLLVAGCSRRLVEPATSGPLPPVVVPREPTMGLPLNAIPNPAGGSISEPEGLKRMPADAVLSLPPGDGSAQYHEVKAGETLNAIAARYGLSGAAVSAANGLDNPNAIRPGQLLYIPPKR